MVSQRGRETQNIECKRSTINSVLWLLVYVNRSIDHSAKYVRLHNTRSRGGQEIGGTECCTTGPVIDTPTLWSRTAHDAAIFIRWRNKSS